MTKTTKPESGNPATATTLDRLRAPYAAQGYTGLHLEWRLLRRLGQLAVAWAVARWSLRGAERIGRRVFAYGRPVVKLEREASLCIGEEVRIESGVHRARLSVRHRARLVIGDDVRLNGCILSANAEVIVKDRARIGPWAHVMDGDFHSTADRAAAGELRPVIIEEDAWLTTRCMVLKGVTIGRGAVVAAGSVVTKDVEPYTVVAGVPARVVKRLPGYRADANTQEVAEVRRAALQAYRPAAKPSIQGRMNGSIRR